MEEHVHELSELSFDPRPEIRENALQDLFDSLRNHGHLFSLPLWERVFESVLFRIFDSVQHTIDPSGDNFSGREVNNDTPDFYEDSWLFGTCTLSLELVVDLFIKFYSAVSPLRRVLILLVSFIKHPHQSLAGIGVAAFVRLVTNAGHLFPAESWFEVVSSLKEAATHTLPDFSFVVQNKAASGKPNPDQASVSTSTDELYSSLSDARIRCATQLLLVQAVHEIQDSLLSKTHMHPIRRLTCGSIQCPRDQQRLGPLLKPRRIQIHYETETYQMCLTLLQNLLSDRPPLHEETQAESLLISLCTEVLHSYIQNSGSHIQTLPDGGKLLWRVPLGSCWRRESSARAPLVVSTLDAISVLEETSFERNLPGLFPLLSSLIRCHHGSIEVQKALGELLSSAVGPVLLRSC